MKIFTSISDGAIVPDGAPFVLNGIAYPHNWLELASDEDLAAHGIAVAIVADPAPPAIEPGVAFSPPFAPLI